MDSTLIMFVFLLLLFGMFYFLIIRPQRRRQKEHQDLLASLRRGDRVVTIGGIHGQVESITEDSFVIKVESGVTLRMAKGSIAFKPDTKS